MAASPAGNPDGRVGRVDRVDRCRLVVHCEPWPYAERHAAEIDAHWARHASAEPRLFNGTVYMLATQALAAGEYAAAFKPVAFKSFYFWRAQGFPAADLYDAFGSALIRSAEGHVLLGRQRAGNLNAGLSYLPGGFIDPRDVGADGHIDIAASVAREVAEETGLDAAALERVPGFVLTRCAHQVSIGVEFRSALGSDELAARVRDYLRRDPQSELADIDVVRARADLATLHMPRFAEVLLDRLFGDATNA